MPMNAEDADIVNAEVDSDPVRYHDYDPNNALENQWTRLHPGRTNASVASARQQSNTGERSEAVEEVESEDSSSEDERADERSVPSQRHRLSYASRTSTKMEEEFMHYLERHPTAVKRIQDHRLQHSRTVGSSRPGADGESLPSFGGSKPYPPPLPDREEYVVEFDGHEDPRHAQNWPTKKKLIISAIMIFDSLAATFASSIFSPAASYVSVHSRSCSFMNQTDADYI